MCSEAWDLNDASVACKQLDCGRAHRITTQNEYGLGNGHTWGDQIECGGMESTLAQCTHRPFTDKTCNTTAVAGVICTGQRITQTHIYVIETHISLSFKHIIIIPSQEVWKSDWWTARTTVPAGSRFVTESCGTRCVTRTGLWVRLRWCVRACSVELHLRPLARPILDKARGWWWRPAIPVSKM